MRIFAILSLLTLSFVASATSVYQYPDLHKRQKQLQAQMIDAVNRGDIPRMERVCREGINLIPDDPLWHYNLACALAYRADQKDAYEELELAITLGYRDVNQIKGDTDLQRLKDRQRVEDAIARAQELGDKPAPGKKPLAHAFGTMGTTVTIEENNLSWNYDHGLFLCYLKLSSDELPAAVAARYNGPAAKKIRKWIKEGTAAGNLNDLYFNRDSKHSMIVTTNFPWLVSIEMEQPAKKLGLDRMTPNMLFEFPVFGNASLALTDGYFRRSIGRLHMTEQDAAARMCHLYANNQFWVFPAHKDFSRAEGLDFFPAQAPYQLITEGSSYTDKRYVEAALAASAAMSPETKTSVLASWMMGPTLQWLFRSTRPGVKSAADYLSPKAHPTVWGPNDLDVDALVEKAHSLKASDIPPVCGLTLVDSPLVPVKVPRMGVDYLDISYEPLVMQPMLTAIILRDYDPVRTFLVRATPVNNTRASRFAWAVVHGDASKVRIEAVAGAPDLTPERGVAKITIDRTELTTNRIDIACFAKGEGTEWGAPAFISFNGVPHEKRVYADGVLQSIDYTNPEGFYTDPLIALPRRWKDVFHYENGKRTGWTRFCNGMELDEFDAEGRRIVDRDADGKPTKCSPVQYIMRDTGVKGMPPELTYVDAEVKK